MGRSIHRWCRVASRMLGIYPTADVPYTIRVLETKQNRDRLAFLVQNERSLLRCHFSFLSSFCPCRCIYDSLPWCWTLYSSVEIHEGSCFESVVRVVVNSRSSFIIVIVVVVVIILLHIIRLSALKCHGKSHRGSSDNWTEPICTYARKTVWQSESSR